VTEDDEPMKSRRLLLDVDESSANRTEAQPVHSVSHKSVKDMTPVEYYWMHKNRATSKPHTEVASPQQTHK